MKVRKLSLIVALVLLSAILLAAPVQAGRTTTSFTFQLQSLDNEYFDIREVGGVWHVNWGIAGPVVGTGDDRVTGYFTWDVKTTWQLSNPHGELGDWGRGTGQWRIVGADGSGWKGNADGKTRGDVQPLTPFHGWGVGFGKYQGMRIQWIENEHTPPNWLDFVFRGEITENSD